ncbi:type I-E CRISPR-associated protein Cse2/CasB [Actinomyces viscosus]|uniref:CRISPR-associated Cse2 family protein n=1 Tax=Actinomyces viscosus TaxID=1656 RepID=A0A448PK48_ACTVI|nr:type I-E CRISPR-associated protein Cse2/CasB [Actinomyces viscosus]TFH53173.1 type I-E CRISPR-associated protein Cse2/CasB [Actinomyces viscosus]VEI15519.1 CRISPR-associated Cse2 family protein [Actinomyces viscosus]
MTVSDTSAPANAANAVPPGNPPRAYRPRLEENAGRLVNQRIGGTKQREGLQSRYRRNEARARGELAVLRKGANRPPGELPEIWELTSVHVPDYVDDAPTWEETAVHTAMTLYAVHQQSRTEPMFVPGRGLGHAARILIGPPDDENPSARARFNALVTSTTVTELRHHLRGIISLFRARSIPLDHAMLADDILHFQQPGGARKVRLAWARQYQSLPVEPPLTTDDASPASDPVSTTTAPNPEN